MSTSYVVFLVIFIILMALFAYFGTRNGVLKSVYSFLRIGIPMLLSGIIVKISHLISKVELVSFIIGGIGTVIFYLVLRGVIGGKTENNKNKKKGIVDYFLGFIIGAAEGWLIIGFVTIYLNYFQIIKIQEIIPSLYQAIVKPLQWILFFKFNG